MKTCTTCIPYIDTTFIQISSGEFGCIYQDKTTSVIYKYQEINTNHTAEKLHYEYYMTMEFWKACIGPYPIDRDLYETCSIITMTPIYITIGDYLVNCIMNPLITLDMITIEIDKLLDAINNVLQIMCHHKLTHSDFHWWNIALQNKEYYNNDDCKDAVYFIDFEGNQYRFVCIDFGWASKGIKCNQLLEILALFRSTYNFKLKISSTDYKDREKLKLVSNLLYSNLLQIINYNIGMTYKLNKYNINLLNDEYMTMHYKYQRRLFSRRVSAYNKKLQREEQMNVFQVPSFITQIINWFH